VGLLPLVAAEIEDVRVPVRLIAAAGRIGGGILSALQGKIGGIAAFAIHATERAGFGRNQVHAQRNAQTPGMDRTEEISIGGRRHI
jgi:hypothetical protein